MIQSTSYVRVFADAAGETRFEEVEVPMGEMQALPGAPPLHRSDAVAASNVVWARFPAEWHSTAHLAPRRQLLVLLSGALEVRTSDGDRKRFTAGDCLVVEDTTGKGHGASALEGDATVVIIAFA